MSLSDPNIEIKELKQQLEEAHDLIEAIKTGSIDALAINGKDGPKIYTLKSADQSYRTLVEKMNEGAVVLDRNGYILYCNATFALFTGSPLEDVIGRSFFEFVADSYTDIFKKIFVNGWKRNEKGEIILKHKNGKLTPFSVSMNTMELDEIPALGIIVTDLSSKNEIELVRSQVAAQNKIIEENNKQLLKQQQGNQEADRLRFILEGISQMTWTNLENGEVNFFNKRWYDYTGKTFEETKKYGWQGVLHPDDVAHTLETYKNSLETGMPFEVENRYQRSSDGSYRWHINRSMPIKNSNNDIILWVGTATDIHDQKLSEEKFRFLAETVPQIFWTANPEGNLDYFNEKWFDYTGMSYDQTKDWGWAPVMHPDDINNCISRWRLSLETGSDYQNESRYKRASDGMYRWHLTRAQPLKDKDGIITKWFGTSTDIHEQKEAMQNLYLAQDQLKTFNLNLNEKNEQLLKINSDLDNFVYTASHDLKAPVSNIEGLMSTLQDMLLNNPSIDPEIEMIIKMIFDSIERFKSTIHDLTEITKIQKGAGEDIEMQNICKVIDDIKINISEMIKREDAVIETDFECPEILFSKKNLYSVLYNLISNSIKYKAFDRPPHIKISTQATNESLILSVTDNGLGMDLSEEKKIFAMFKRLHDHVEGSGIGLYLVKRIVDNAGGRIEVESKVGEGTTFRVYFKK